MPEKILVIDDEETTVQLISILLERRGYEVIRALRAEDGLRKAYRTHPDLVLLDIMMPDMDGWDVCRRLRELSDVPIVFLTARSDMRDVVRGLEMVPTITLSNRMTTTNWSRVCVPICADRLRRPYLKN